MSRKAKRYLMLLAAIGLVAVVVGGGSGTFASFNAQVANTGNYFATGTLFLHATKQGSSNICKSEVDSGNANILSTNGCDTLFTFPNISAGQTETVNLQLDNAGSINASALKFSLGSTGCANSKSTITTTTGTLSTGAQTTIAVSALPYALVKGTSITIVQGSNTDVLTLNANAAASATSIDVTGSSTTHSYTASALIQYSATFGSSNLCSNLLFYIDEANSSWGTPEKCIYGGSSGASCSFGTTTAHVSDVGTSLNDLTSSLWSNGMSSALDAGGTRWITIGIEAPASLTNANQNQSATFDLKWDLEQ